MQVKPIMPASSVLEGMVGKECPLDNPISRGLAIAGTDFNGGASLYLPQGLSLTVKGLSRLHDYFRSNAFELRVATKVPSLVDSIPEGYRIPEQGEVIQVDAPTFLRSVRSTIGDVGQGYYVESFGGGLAMAWKAFRRHDQEYGFHDSPSEPEFMSRICPSVNDIGENSTMGLAQRAIGRGLAERGDTEEKRTLGAENIRDGEERLSAAEEDLELLTSLDGQPVSSLTRAGLVALQACSLELMGSKGVQAKDGSLSHIVGGLFIMGADPESAYGYPIALGHAVPVLTVVHVEAVRDMPDEHFRKPRPHVQLRIESDPIDPEGDVVSMLKDASITAIRLAAIQGASEAMPLLRTNELIDGALNSISSCKKHARGDVVHIPATAFQNTVVKRLDNSLRSVEDITDEVILGWM